MTGTVAIFVITTTASFSIHLITLSYTGLVKKKKMRLKFAILSSYACSLFFPFSNAAANSNSNSICYYPNKEIAEGETPCNSSAEHSSCCSTDDVCLSNSYCFNRSGRVVRSSCTDRNWESAACPYFCRDGMYIHTVLRTEYSASSRESVAATI